MRKFYPRQKINLVELEEWKHYTLEESFPDFISELSFETMKGLTVDDLAHYAEQFWKTRIDSRQREILYLAFQDNDPRLEQFRILISDASNWAWEEAYTPTDVDLQQSLKRALNEIPSEYADWFSGKPILWKVYKAFGYKEQWKFITDLLRPLVYIEAKPGKYDRFLIYDPAASVLVERIATEPLSPEPEGILDWAPPVTVWKSGLRKELIELLDELRDLLIPMMFKYLHNRMNDVDYSNRMNFDLQIRKMLKYQYPEVKAAGKEIKEFLASSPSMGANPFMNPRNRRLEKDFREMKALAEASPILEFDVKGDPPETYLLRFHGLGLDPAGTRDLHEVSVDLGAEYPRSMPLVRWHTPIMHPNIASGTPCFGNFTMNPQVRLIDLVEILWDMTRMAIYNVHQNETWSRLRKQYDFPMDPRTIRGEVAQVRDPGGDADLIIMGRY
jgi:ubiquitin-protein ligase